MAIVRPPDSSMAARYRPQNRDHTGADPPAARRPTVLVKAPTGRADGCS